MTGAEHMNIVEAWAKGAARPSKEEGAVVKHAWEIVHLLLEVESPAMIQRWLMGMNPDLDDQSPALLLRREPERVLAAARSFRDCG